MPCFLTMTKDKTEQYSNNKTVRYTLVDFQCRMPYFERIMDTIRLSESIHILNIVRKVQVQFRGILFKKICLVIIRIKALKYHLLRL